MNVMSGANIRILGSARALPDGDPVNNEAILERDQELRAKGKEYLAKMSRRIEDRFGVRERYLIQKPWEGRRCAGETSEDLALRALEKAIGAQSAKPSLLIHGTTTPSRYTGSQAASILGRLGIVAPGYEIKAGCSTSIASLHMALAFLRAGYPDVSVACAETLSKVMDPDNRETWFGLADGGAAVWMEINDAEPDFAILRSYYCTDGKHVELYTTRGVLPPNAADCEASLYSLRGDAERLRALSRERYSSMLEEIISPAFPLSGIDWVVPHQVNLELIRDVMVRHGMNSRVIWTAGEVGNLGGASVLFALADALEKRVFRKNDRILLMSVGGGLSFAAQVWQKL